MSQYAASGTGFFHGGAARAVFSRRRQGAGQARKAKEPPEGGSLLFQANGSELILAEWTGLEPATPGVTGRYSNRLNYHSASV